jgi:hypothetical protein
LVTPTVIQVQALRGFVWIVSKVGNQTEIEAHYQKKNATRVGDILLLKRFIVSDDLIHEIRRAKGTANRQQASRNSQKT